MREEIYNLCQDTEVIQKKLKLSKHKSSEQYLRAVKKWAREKTMKGLEKWKLQL